jgi:biotin synthase
MDGGVLERAGELARGPLEGEGLGREAALELAALAGEDLWSVLFWSNRIRRRHRGDRVHLCGIVAAKVGRCSEDCQWCSQSGRYASGVEARGLLGEEELAGAARAAVEAGTNCFGFVTSGERPTAEELERLCAAYELVRAEGRVTACASLGAIAEAEAGRLEAAGCRRYNHNLETSRRHYERVVTTHSFDERLATARAVKAAGLELCCGGLFGMGETAEDRVDLALELRAVGADIVPVNFLRPMAGTPLADTKPLEPREGLAIIALLRFMLPTQCINIAGGRELCLRDLQSWMFHAGADGCLLGNYLTYGGRAAAEDLRMIADLGLRPTSSCSERGGT